MASNVNTATSEVPSGNQQTFRRLDQRVDHGPIGLAVHLVDVAAGVVLPRPASDAAQKGSSGSPPVAAVDSYQPGVVRPLSAAAPETSKARSTARRIGQTIKTEAQERGQEFVRRTEQGPIGKVAYIAALVPVAIAYAILGMGKSIARRGGEVVDVSNTVVGTLHPAPCAAQAAGMVASAPAHNEKATLLVAH